MSTNESIICEIGIKLMVKFKRIIRVRKYHKNTINLIFVKESEPEPTPISVLVIRWSRSLPFYVN